ncbi:hypothetical protein [Mesoterricola silvestris]|nr:hypothetical protein [Mesoterricola silvestris]
MRFLAIAACAAHLLAQAPARLDIRPAGRVQLGSTGPREVRTVAYTFTNISDRPIALRVGELSPGVTVRGPALDGPFAPGQSLGLTLTLDPADFVGPQARNVRLLTDDPHQGEYRLPVAVDVRADLTVDAQRKSLGVVAPHESPQAVFTFTRETGQPTVLRLTGDVAPYLETEVVPGTPSSRLLVTLRPALIPPGTALGLETLRVETSAPLQPRFDLYLDWKLHHPIEALPSRVVFLDPAVPVQTLLLKARDGKAFALEGADVEGAGFERGPLPAAAPEMALEIRRTAPDVARALLVLRFKGQEPPLKVPLSYLPGSKPPVPPAASPSGDPPPRP